MAALCTGQRTQEKRDRGFLSSAACLPDAFHLLFSGEKPPKWSWEQMDSPPAAMAPQLLEAASRVPQSPGVGPGPTGDTFRGQGVLAWEKTWLPTSKGEQA